MGRGEKENCDATNGLKRKRRRTSKLNVGNGSCNYRQRLGLSSERVGVEEILVEGDN